MRLCFAVLVLAACTIRAQTPQVLAVTNAVSPFSPPSPDGFITIYGTGLSDGGIYNPPGLPWPTQLGTTQVRSCPYTGAVIPVADCTLLPLTYVSSTQVNAYVPDSFAKNSAAPWLFAQISVTVNGVVATPLSANFAIGDYSSPVPSIFIAGYDCLIDPRYQYANVNCGLSWNQPNPDPAVRGLITDTSGNLITSSNPAHLNQYIIMWAESLYDQTNHLAILMSDVPAYELPNPSNYPIEAAYAGQSAWPGLYQVNVQIPASLATGEYGITPAWPCGNYNWEIQFALNGGANLVNIPIVVHSGDVPCTQ